MYLGAGDCANFYILLCSMRAEFSYTYNSTQNRTHKGGGRCAYRAPTARMVAEEGMGFKLEHTNVQVG